MQANADSQPTDVKHMGRWMAAAMFFLQNQNLAVYRMFLNMDFKCNGRFDAQLSHFYFVISLIVLNLDN